LERIARDSATDHGPVMEVLTAYIRHHAACIYLPEAPEGPNGEVLAGQVAGTEMIPADIQAILTTIGRRVRTHPECRPIDLGLTRLENADLRLAYLAGAQLSWADLRWADLTDADLRGSNLQSADLVYTHLNRSNLSNIT